jgi:predicted DCC family thiol-disulfide oxidoreductase YuxK
MTDTSQTASRAPAAHDGAPTALYHGACPICGTEIDHYKRYCAERGIEMGWTDISDGTDTALLDRLGLDREDAKKRMTVVGPDGTVHRGVAAFILMWERMPRYRWLARLVSLPGLHWLADKVYEGLLAPALYAWNRRRGRSNTAG